MAANLTDRQRELGAFYQWLERRADYLTRKWAEEGKNFLAETDNEAKSASVDNYSTKYKQRQT